MAKLEFGGCKCPNQGTLGGSFYLFPFNPLILVLLVL
jgi:hypothetical protein